MKSSGVGRRTAQDGRGGPERNRVTRDVKVLQLAQAVSASSRAEELAQKVDGALAELMDAPMRGQYFLDPASGRMTSACMFRVSDVFLARYERLGRPVDPLMSHVVETGSAVSNTMLMSTAEWLESPLYTRVTHLHEMRQLVNAPIVNDEGVVGTLHIARSEPDRSYGPDDVRLMEALGRLVGTALAGFSRHADLERQHDQAVAALELADTAVVVCEPGAIEPRLSSAARHLLEAVANPQESLHRLLARITATGDASHHLDVELVSGLTGRLRAHTRHLGHQHGTMVTVLQLLDGRAQRSAGAFVVLTDREREVATLVTDGLTDREIAQELSLSRHTVSQYVKQVYSKVGVSSRVELTRLLIEP